MTATASGPIHLGASRAAWNRVPLDEGGVRSDDASVSRTSAVPLRGRVRAIGRDEDLGVTSSRRLWTTLMDGVTLLGVVWSIPIVMLVVGTPVALAIVSLLWLVRLALGAF